MLGMALPGGPIIQALGGIRATVFCVLGIALSAMLWVQSHRLSEARDDLALERERSAVLRTANVSAQEAVRELEDANRRWSELAAANKHDSELAVAAVQRERDALRDELDRRRVARGTIYEADQDAAAWGRAHVPARIADGLRQ